MDKAKVKRPRGGQTKRTPELDEQILAWIADGQTLASFCRKPRTPATRTVEDWKEKDEGFAAAYAHAREIGGAIIAERMRDTAGKRDSTRQDDVQHRRLIIDTDKWLLARWFPTQYGDRVAVTDAEGAPIRLSNSDAVRELALLFATAQARQITAKREAEADELAEDNRLSIELTKDE